MTGQLRSEDFEVFFYHDHIMGESIASTGPVIPSVSNCAGVKNDTRIAMPTLPDANVPDGQVEQGKLRGTLERSAESSDKPL